MREVADVRIHGTTAEPPIERFERDERSALTPLAAKAPFLQVRELSRRVHTDACIELDTNRYSVPWKLIGETVTVVVAERQVRVLYAAEEVASHAQNPADAPSVIERSHLVGIVGAHLVGVSWLGSQECRGGAATGRHRLNCCDRWPSMRQRLEGAGDDHRQEDQVKRRTERPGTDADEAQAHGHPRSARHACWTRPARAELNLREALTMLCTAEVARKDERRIQMGMSIAKFPCVRTLESFEYDAQPSVDAKQIRELATSRWVANGDSVLLLGPPGVGKTHLAVALGREAIVRGYSDAVRAGNEPGDAVGQSTRGGTAGGEADPLHQAQAAGGRRAGLSAFRGECRASVLPTREPAL
jgi:hypothetical protein